jgi:phage terminase large subunit-like protein
LPRSSDPRAATPDPVTAYALEVLAGRILAGPHVRDACRRHLRDLEEASDRGYTFRLDLVERAFEFFRGILRLNAGQFEGKPFELQPWQAFIVGSIFGWVDAEGSRRFRVAYIETGKGNGKSPLAAGVGLYMMIADDEARAEVYAAASKRDQAMVSFRDAVAMVDQSPTLAARVHRTGGENPWNLSFRGSFFRPIASDDNQSGPRPHCGLVDELHEHRDGVVLEMLRAGFKGRRSPLLFITTNAGFDRATVCWAYHDKACKVGAGTITDERFFAYVCALDLDDKPLADERCWLKTNPNLGQSIRSGYLREQVDEARLMPSKESIVRRLHFCEWVDAAAPWILGDAWRACEVEPAGELLAWLSPKGEPLTLAVDLSLTTDLSALALAAEVGSVCRMGVEFWTPADTLRARADRDAIDYPLWVQQGYLNAVPGSTLDYTPIAQRIADIASRVRVDRVVFDRYKMPYLRRAMDELGLELELVEHPQTFVRLKGSVLWMPESINQMESAVLERTVEFWRNPVLTWCAASAVVNLDEQGSRTFSKRKSTGRIDGLVAATMAIGALRTVQPEVDVASWIA